MISTDIRLTGFTFDSNYNLQSKMVPCQRYDNRLVSINEQLCMICENVYNFG